LTYEMLMGVLGKIEAVDGVQQARNKDRRRGGSYKLNRTLTTDRVEEIPRPCGSSIQVSKL
jgi:hypothetical protein